MRQLMVLICLLLLLGLAAADDKQPAAKPKPLTVEQASDNVLEAVKAKEAAALTALAEKDQPDPWLVADLLCYRGEHDAAEAFAKAAPRQAVEKLPAYVAVWRTREPDKKKRELVAAMNTALGARTPQKVMEGTASLAPEMDTVIRIRLQHARGLALQMLLRPEDSAQAFHEAADAALALGWLGRASRLYFAAGISAHRGSALPRALAYFEQAYAQETALGDKRRAANTLTNIGDVHADLGDFAKALEVYAQARVEAKAVGDKHAAARTLVSSGIVLADLGDFAKALEVSGQALVELNALGDKRGAAASLMNIGSVHMSLGDYAKALEAYQQVLAEMKALGDKRGAAQARGNIGLVHAAWGDLAKALEAYEHVLADMKAMGDMDGVSASLTNMASVYMTLGDYAKALELYEQVLAQAKARGSKPQVARVLGNIGLVHASLGDYVKALGVLEQALAAKKALGDKAGAATTLGNIGVVHQSLGDFAKALHVFEQALGEQNTVGDKHGAAVTLGSIGNLHQGLGDYARALGAYEQALAEMKDLGDKVGAAGVLSNIGIAHRRLGDQAKAREVYEQAYSQQMALGDKVGAAGTLANLGHVHHDLGDTAKAREAYEQAHLQQKALGDKLGAASTLGSMGIVHAVLGDYAQALKCFSQSARAARSLRATPLLILAYGNLAQLHLDTGHPSRALGAAQKALREVESVLGGLGQEQGALARAKHASLFAVGTLAAVREQDAAEAFSFMESGRAGALLDLLDKRELLRWRAESLPPELRRLDLEAQANQRRARLAYDLLVKRGGNLEARRAASEALDEASEGVRAVAGRIQRELKQQQAGLFYPRAKTIEEIEETLEADQALVLFGLCQDEALALVLRKDGERVVSLGKASGLVAACEALDATDASTNPKPVLDALRKLLIEPLKLEEGVKQVLVSPEGRLCYLPFGALFKQTVAMTPSGTTHLLLLGEERAKGTGILALGDPDYAGASKAAQEIYYRGRTLSPLPATRTEVETIGTQTLLGAKASETGLRDVLPSAKRWRAVHFACHGLVDIDRPMLSSLALSRAGEDDGFLTALEILRTKIPADLAVLSACETGKGKIVKGEGIVGLTRAFMFAGAPRVICSLWKVDDEATQALMVKFYELWNPKEGKGVPAAAALKQAQAHIRSQEKWKHPYYWAAWVLWGLPR